MSNYQVYDGAMAQTKSSPIILAAQFAAATLLGASFPNAAVSSTGDVYRRPSEGYVVLQSPKTAISGGESVIELLEPNFDAEVALFYARLAEAQQPLGIEFEKVLADNLWDLYAVG